MKEGGEGDNRRQDGWIPSLTHGHEFEQAPEDEEQVCLVCYSPWGHKGLDTTATEQQTWNYPKVKQREC